MTIQLTLEATRTKIEHVYALTGAPPVVHTPTIVFQPQKLLAFYADGKCTGLIVVGPRILKGNRQGQQSEARYSKWMLGVSDAHVPEWLWPYFKDLDEGGVRL